MKGSKIAVYETDVQKDFSFRTGALFVHANKPWNMQPYGAEEKLPSIVALHQFAAENEYRVLGSVDRHFYEDAELIRNENGVFVDHCMNGTSGQLRTSQLEPQKDVYVRSKDGPLIGVRTYTEAEASAITDSGMQIMFEKQSYDVATNPNFEIIFGKLMDDGLKKVIVNGFATDYCVKAAVLAMQKQGVQTYVVEDAIESVNIDFQGNIDPEFGQKALEEMAQAGARLVTTKDVLEGRI